MENAKKIKKYNEYIILMEVFIFVGN